MTDDKTPDELKRGSFVRANRLAEQPASTITSRLGRHLTRTVMVVVAATAAGLSFAGAAQAAGTPTLDRLIISNPEPGWSTLSGQELGQLSQEIQTELTSKAPANETYATAVEGWQSPKGSSNALLAIFLVQVMGGAVDMSPSSVASNFCSGATNITPGSTPAIPNVPSSAIAACSGNGLKTTIGVAAKGTILEMVASAGSNPLGVSSVERVVMSQFNAIPGASSPPGSGTSSGAVVGGAVGGIVLIGVVIALVLLRRRSPELTHADAEPHFASGQQPPTPQPPTQQPLTQQPPTRQSPGLQPPVPFGSTAPPPPPGVVSQGSAYAPDPTVHVDGPTGPAPGWYPEPGDATVMKYWDGMTFAASRRWNGTGWVDA